MLPIADGSDTGGSLRNPPAFCNVVGLRPSPGRVASESTSWSPLSVCGPIARTVADVALFLSAIAGPDPRVRSRFRKTRRASAHHSTGISRAFASPGGAAWAAFRSSPRSAGSSMPTAQVFEDLGCIVEEAEPDFTGVDEAFPLLRYAANHARYAPLVQAAAGMGEGHDQVRGGAGGAASGADIGRALARQARMFDQSRQFFERYEYFILPVTQVEPFDVNTPYPTEIAGTTMTTYIDWMRSCWYVTMMSNPAISVPGRVLGHRTAGRPADRRPSSRRVERAAARPRVRAGDASRRRRPSLLGSCWFPI